MTKIYQKKIETPCFIPKLHKNTNNLIFTKYLREIFLKENPNLFCVPIKACFFFSGTVFVIKLHEFFSEMDDRIFKISNDSESEGLDTRRDEAFLANRISDIPEKTG
jgi:hypothetical protein